MGKFIDLTGQIFGKLTVIERVENRGKQTMWRCQCTCGTKVVVCGGDLKNGHTKSCGCLGGKFKDLTEMTFGKLTVLECVGNTKGGHAQWLCRCECGNEVIVASSHLKSEHTKSCGCLQRNKVGMLNKKHGMRGTKIYNTWKSIKKRCFNPNCKDFGSYGGRGIKMFEAWINDFQAFYDYVSKLPHYGEAGYSLDRINNNGNYEPNNLRWATAKEQGRNKRNNRIVQYDGEKMCLAEAVEKSNIQLGTVIRRISRGEKGEFLFRLPKKNKSK